MRTFKKVLITGIAGSGGSYLAEYIAGNHPEVEIHGISRWHSTLIDNLSEVKDKAKVHECDLNDLSSIIRSLEEVKPDVIFHLASHANVRTSFITPLSVINSRYSEWSGAATATSTGSPIMFSRIQDTDDCLIYSLNLEDNSRDVKYLKLPPTQPSTQ